MLEPGPWEILSSNMINVTKIKMEFDTDYNNAVCDIIIYSTSKWDLKFVTYLSDQEDTDLLIPIYKAKLNTVRLDIYSLHWDGHRFEKSFNPERLSKDFRDIFSELKEIYNASKPISDLII